MTAEPSTVDQPKHPTPALTTYELRNYRRELEHTLKTFPEDATVRERLQQQLAEVLTEQQARAQLQQSGRP